MNEDEAQAWISDRFGAVALNASRSFVDRVLVENVRQNLVAASTLDAIWARHVVDSAQLALLSDINGGPWVDVGTGGGFPGLIVAMLRDEPFILVEPRKRRAAFLESAIEAYGLANRVTVAAVRVETLLERAGTISARAVAPVHDLLLAAEQCSHADTTWVLPRGKITSEELAYLRESWHFTFHVEQSVTNPGSSILILRHVARR